MKFAILLLSILTISRSFGQVEFYVHDTLVDNQVLQQLIVGNQQSFPTMIYIKNIGSTTKLWHIKQCLLNDDPNIETGYIIMGNDLDPFGGIGVPPAAITFPCWDIDFYDVTVQPGERLFYDNLLTDIGPGCELYRYYLMDQNGVVDSIDINYCSTLDASAIYNSVVKIYPNPAREKVSIKLDKENALLDVFNLQGEKVIADLELNGDAEVSIEGLPSGAYILQIYFENQVIRERIIKFDD